MASKAKDGNAKYPDEGFEALYKRLDETVGKLEQGNLTLAESLALYEEGMKLARRCQELLQSAELKVTSLQESFSRELGAIREELEEYEPAMPPDEPPPE